MAALLAVAAVLAASPCGNYCGAWFCGGGTVTSSTGCNYNVTPRDLFDGGDSCVDACCMVHDQCCDADDDTSGCNAAMLRCLAACDPTAASCLYGWVPFPAWAYRATFLTVESWCCNAPC